MTTEPKLECLRPDCGKAMERPSEGACWSTTDLALLSGWGRLDAPAGAVLWACPEHRSLLPKDLFDGPTPWTLRSGG